MGKHIKQSLSHFNHFILGHARPWNPEEPSTSTFSYLQGQGGCLCHWAGLSLEPNRQGGWGERTDSLHAESCLAGPGRGLDLVQTGSEIQTYSDMHLKFLRITISKMRMEREVPMTSWTALVEVKTIYIILYMNLRGSHQIHQQLAIFAASKEILQLEGVAS